MVSEFYIDLQYYPACTYVYTHLHSKKFTHLIYFSAARLDGEAPIHQDWCPCNP